MNEFWQEIWDYLGLCRPDVGFGFITSMWDAAQYLEGNKLKPHLDLDVPYWAKSKIGLPSPDIYLFLCDVCKRISFKENKKLPLNLHNRIVLGDQNDHTKEYIRKWGV